ncbi:RTA1-domain-containing protein [Mycena venus]|uniref:RTA1-domain-containing protein n=1 Tax=Mycena venus TaxID=2733690 RepID=A0A8H6Z243_9AGAR|nr:RTA1-domain-containing protein [Mycena venus]
MVQVKCLDPHSDNYNFLYCPSFPAAVLFSALFGLTTLAHLVQAVHYRKRFCWVIIMAASWETAGLVLRVFSVLNTTSTTYGIPSQLLILLSPLWINAFLYVLMARLVYFFVPEKHVAGISARRLSLCFVLLDITAFLAQAGGGSMISNTDPKSALLGIHIYMGGIGLQQFFVLGFTSLVIRFHYKMNRLDGSTDWKRPLYVMYASLPPHHDPYRLPPHRVLLGRVLPHHHARGTLLLPRGAPNVRRTVTVEYIPPRAGARWSRQRVPQESEEVETGRTGEYREGFRGL